VGGVASLESSEIAGIAVTFSVVAVVILVIVLVFLVEDYSDLKGGGWDGVAR
jgi:hypothetical protein